MTKNIALTKPLSNEEIAVLILSTNNLYYDQFKEAVLNSWFKEMQNEGIKCYFYSGDHNFNDISGNQIRVNVSDNLKHTAEKLFSAFQVLMNAHEETKLVYRTNLSSYIEVKNFLQFIKSRRLDVNTYTGIVGETNYSREFFKDNRLISKVLAVLTFNQKIKFASGSGFFIGKNNIEKILKSKCKFNLIDDVMVAMALNIEPDQSVVPLRFDIKENESHKLPNIEYDKLIHDEFLFHYRFKTSDRNKDAEMLREFNNSEYRYLCCTKP